MIRFIHLAVVASAMLLAAVPQAWAQFQLNIYGGAQSLPQSSVSGADPSGVGDFGFDVGWHGKSFEVPPYFGVRGVWWRRNDLGFALDFTHAKAEADSGALSGAGFEVLEFTDGINTLTVNALKRFEPMAGFRPYLGGGVGIAIPRVDVQSSNTAPRTVEYQYGGVVAQFQGGVEYQLSDDWTVFGEYKMNYVDLEVDLEGGGALSTDLITNSVNLGAGFSF